MANKGQNLLEYVVIVGVVLTAVFALSPLLRRSVQTVVKLVADQVANQENAEQLHTDRSGFLESSFSSTRAAINKTTNEFLGENTYHYDDRSETFSNSLVNLGFTNRN